ncbi:MAG: circularly permuted type 2 ATP-grasp protein [Alphaproteobacteria bacterium]|nr:circularly permuted type 2 ATP-grasp protein [Alphaproteobacteria bacterium]
MAFPFSYPVQCETGGYNELLTPDGKLRPHWRSFFEAVEKEGKEKFISYTDQTARLMSADVLAAAAKQNHTHGVIPFILPYEEFKTISAGLIQRAELINRMLADLYGEQKLIMQAVLPPQIIFGNPFYMPALKNIRPPNSVFLQEYAVDLERAPDGRFWVVSDKTQTPEGVGLAIKNRLILSRVMPDIYAKAAPTRIFDFFEAMRRHLFASAPTKDKTKIPLIVLLSGAVKKKLSFEEAFFARSLGISAVDPADLSVRGDHVYLKNIDGLKPVDVILRRIDDTLCDPLELNGSSLFGIAGLTEVVRHGNVALINPLGAGLAEIPALRAFIHGINRFFNNEELLLPSIAAWWCGQPAEKEYVLEHLSDLKIYDLKGGKVHPSASEIEEHPENFVAQERVNASLSPVLQNGELVPARTRLRFHLIYENGSYRVLTGGLAFTQAASVSLRDIWVEGGQIRQEKASVVQAVSSPTAPVRTTFELTSRIADNMFWLGRNLERSEQLARLLRVAVERATEGPESPEPNDVATLLFIFALTGHLPFKDYQNTAIQKESLAFLREIMVSPDYGFGLYFLFRRLKDMADLLHDRLSMDTWELFTQLVDLLPEKNANSQILLNRLKELILRQSALSGLIREDMTRDHSWRFMEIGRRLERGMQILNLLSGIECCANNGFNASLETLLETLDSRMTYRVRYMAVPTVPLVFDLLVCDDGNPRALIYQVLKLRQNISVLERDSRLPGLFSKELFILEKIISQIKAINVMTLAEQTQTLNETATVNPAFNTAIASLCAQLQEFSDTLTLSCFVHADSTRQGPTYNKGKIK